ncbi:MAG TPA: hypothetical protein VGM37_20805 [Armatimonadota bacterium]|jgi:hypothetical protein
MQDGWFLVIFILAAITFAGALMASWLARLVAQQKESSSLTASDLRLLEESVEALIARLKAASEEAVAELTVRQIALENLLDRVDAALPQTPADPEDAARLAESGLDEAEIARRSGLTRAEVELMLEMQAARR